MIPPPTRPETPPDTWACSAYGPRGLEVGAVCFFGGMLGQRKCKSAEVCHAEMDAERRRVFDRMQLLAEGGDPLWVYMAQTFTSPEQMLNGGTWDLSGTGDLTETGQGD